MLLIFIICQTFNEDFLIAQARVHIIDHAVATVADSIFEECTRQ